MLLFLVIFFILSAVMFLSVSCTRRYRLGQLAKRYQMQYEYYRESVTTLESVGRLEFFTHFFHQYNNVCTFSNAVAFMRLADDILFVDDKPGTKAQHISIFTAELKSQQFAPFKVAPAGSCFAKSNYSPIKTDVAEIDSRYQIYSPIQGSTAFLTPSLLSLLKTRSNIYLEANENALIYHESALVRPQDFQTFRLRGMQILQECAHAATLQANARRGNTTPPQTAQFEAFLSSVLPQQETEEKASTWMGMGLFALLLLAVGLTLFALVLAKNLPH